MDGVEGHCIENRGSVILDGRPGSNEFQRNQKLDVTAIKGEHNTWIQEGCFEDRCAAKNSALLGLWFLTQND